MTKLFTGEWPRLAVIVATWLIVRTFVVSGGLLLQAIFDRVSDDATGISIWVLIAVLAAVYLAQTVTWFNLILGRLEIPFVARIEARLRSNMMSSLLSRPAATSLHQSVGDATSRFIRDVEEVRVLPIWAASNLSRVISSLVMLAIMFSISPVVTVGVILPFAVVLYLARLMDPRVARYRAASRQAAAKVSELIAESMRAAATVTTLGNQEQVTERMRKLGHERERITVTDRTFSEFQATVSMQASEMSAGLIMVLAAHQLSSGTMTVGDMALFVYYAKMVGEVVGIAGVTFQKFRQAHVSMTRLDEVAKPADVLATTPTYLDRPIPAPRPVAARVREPLESLRANGVSARYGNGDGIDGFDLELRRGRLTVLTGPVGSGKTSALRAVLGLLPLQDGVIHWNDAVVSEPHRFLVAPRVAYVPQVPHLFTGTIADNIRMGVDGDVAKVADDALLTADLAELPDGLDTVVGVRGRRLSGGQAQRVALARALIRHPQLLVLDDVDSALDAVTARALWNRLSDDSRTILAVSHNPYVLGRADEVIALAHPQRAATA